MYSPEQTKWQEEPPASNLVEKLASPDRFSYNNAPIPPQPFIARDFAQQPSPAKSVRNESQSPAQIEGYINRSDSEDEATPQSFSRERAMTNDRSSRSSNRGSIYFFTMYL